MQETQLKYRFDLWIRKWQPTPVFLPEKFHGQRNLMGYCPRSQSSKELTLRAQLLYDDQYCSSNSCIPLQIPWRRKWKTTPVFLPGKSHGQRSLAGYKELDIQTERLKHIIVLPKKSILKGYYSHNQIPFMISIFGSHMFYFQLVL